MVGGIDTDSEEVAAGWLALSPPGCPPEHPATISSSAAGSSAPAAMIPAEGGRLPPQSVGGVSPGRSISFGVALLLNALPHLVPGLLAPGTSGRTTPK